MGTARFVALTLALAFGLFGAARDAAASVCSAEEICAAGIDPCVVTSAKLVAAGCLLDFSGRDLHVEANISAEVPGGSFSVQADNVTLKGAKLRSFGSPEALGGTISVTVSGLFATTGSGAGISVNAAAGGGTILIQAGSVDHNSGLLEASGTSSIADGGVVLISATGSVLLENNLQVLSGSGDSIGGSIVVTGDDITINGALNAGGGNLGGGSIEVLALGNLTTGPSIGFRVIGTSATDFGADAGTVFLEALGDILLDTPIVAQGRTPDGTGGTVELLSGGAISILKPLNAYGSGTESSGGDVFVSAEGPILIGADVDVSGGGAEVGGKAVFESGRDLTLPAGADVLARGGFQGGVIETRSRGVFQLDGSLSARGLNDGDGGSVLMEEHCHTTINGTIDVRGSGSLGVAGDITLVGETITVESSAQILAMPCDTLPFLSCTLLVVKMGDPEILAGATLDPNVDTDFDPGLTSCCGNLSLEGEESCDDGNLFNCDGCTASCSIEAVPPCPDDGNECTLNCDPATGCTPKPLSGIPCMDDGEVCTNDLCASGTCNHAPVQCDDGVPCTLDYCENGVGCMAIADDTLCDDGNSCTDGMCDMVLDCSFIPRPDGAGCDDGDFCTTEDTCMNLTCTPLGIPLFCDDGNPCTLDQCTPSAGCSHFEDPGLCPSCHDANAPLPAGTPCADGDLCTIGETCDGLGNCTLSLPLECDDGDPCTFDTCFLGECAHLDDFCSSDCSGLPDETPCSDGLVCTRGACQAGECESVSILCDDDDVCNGLGYCVEGLLGCQQSFPDPQNPACVEPPSEPTRLDDFRCYRVRTQPGTPKIENFNLPLADFVESKNTTVSKQEHLCTPAGADPQTVEDPNTFLTCYKSKDAKDQPKFIKQDIQFSNRLGPQSFQLLKSASLCIPSALDTTASSFSRDPYKCYKAKTSKDSPKFERFDLGVSDLFESKITSFLKPERFCTAVDLNGSGLIDPNAHLACYKVRDAKGQLKFAKPELSVSNEFGDLSDQQLRLTKADLVCFVSRLSN